MQVLFYHLLLRSLIWSGSDNQASRSLSSSELLPASQLGLCFSYEGSLHPAISPMLSGRK